MKQIDLAQWVWADFHKRGWLSHRYRCRKLRGVPMPTCGNERAWLDTRIIQTSVCMDPKSLYAAAKITSEHLDLLAKEHPPEWWEKHAPAGTISPMGTFAAFTALRGVYDAYQEKGYLLGITIPFMLATVREVLLWLLAYGWIILTSAYPFACWLRGQPASLPYALFLALLSGILAAVAEAEYKRQL